MDIIILGGQKCGTTYLFELLGKHPKIINSKVKETDFFSNNELTDKNINRYLRYFPRKFLKERRGLKYLEASPSYLLNRNPEVTSARIKSFNPRAKLICLVRNPIDRAYSAFNMYSKRYRDGQLDWWMNWVSSRNPDYNLDAVVRRKKEEYFDFGLYVENELFQMKQGNVIECGILNQGNYYIGLIEYYKAFPKHQIIVLRNEDFKNNYAEVTEKLSSFLELEPFDWMPFKNFQTFKGDYSPLLNDDVIANLTEYYERANQELRELTGISY